jgi:hypothetical protein
MDLDPPTRWISTKFPYHPDLIPWPEMKATIFKIYDHRLEHAEEIDGTVNTQHLALDEHLILYMLEQH